jgi:hypothetical protein
MGFEKGLGPSTLGLERSVDKGELRGEGGHA